jgi:3-hydroxyisobutyrate dehydrogenase-like beta-hydroxyacid dehydrogenase
MFERGAFVFGHDVAVTRVAVIGLGRMGSRIARRLLDARSELVVWNRTREKMTALTEAGAVAAESPADAAQQADVAITMVSGPPALQAVTEGPSGVCAGATGGLTIIEMSTVGPAAIARLESVVPRDTRLLDAPVLGSIGEAETGSLSIFVGGPAPLVERWTPLLSVLGSPTHVGPLGAGAAAKLVANLTLFGTLALLGEALALADGLGLSRDAAFDVLAATPLAAQAERRRASIESGEYPARFPLPLARKDADLIAVAADNAGVDLRLGPAAASWIADTENIGLTDSDYSAVLWWIIERDRSKSPRQ